MLDEKIANGMKLAGDMAGMMLASLQSNGFTREEAVGLVRDWLIAISLKDQKSNAMVDFMKTLNPKEPVKS